MAKWLINPSGDGQKAKAGRECSTGKDDRWAEAMDDEREKWEKYLRETS